MRPASSASGLPAICSSAAITASPASSWPVTMRRTRISLRSLFISPGFPLDVIRDRSARVRPPGIQGGPACECITRQEIVIDGGWGLGVADYMAVSGSLAPPSASTEPLSAIVAVPRALASRARSSEPLSATLSVGHAGGPRSARPCPPVSRPHRVEQHLARGAAREAAVDRDIGPGQVGALLQADAPERGEPSVRFHSSSGASVSGTRLVAPALLIRPSTRPNVSSLPLIGNKGRWGLRSCAEPTRLIVFDPLR